MYDDRAGRLAALLIGLVPLTARFAMEATPDGPLLLFWTAALWSLAHSVTKDGPGWWLASGLFAGAAMDSKYTAILLPMGVLVFLVFSREHRYWLRRWEPYVAVVIALAVFSPTLIWNAENHWQSFGYQGVDRIRSSDGFTLSFAGLFFRRQLGLVTPFILIWVCVVAVRTLFRWRTASWSDRLGVSLGLPILILFLGLSFFRSVRAHWVAPAYLALFMVSAAAVLRGGPWGKRLHYGTLGILTAAGVALPIVVAASPPSNHRNWEILSAKIRHLKPEFVMAGDYHHAAQLAYHLRPVTAWDLTPAGLGGKSFRSWWRPEPFAGKNAIVLFEKPAGAADLEAVRRCFDRLEGPVEIETVHGDECPQTFQIWTARGYRAPLPEVAARD
jgi:4-amino-4-deoxy-L-arabinose transferase-like glycosyltransferase